MTKEETKQRKKMEQAKTEQTTKKFITFGKTNDGKYFTQVSNDGWDENLDELLGVAAQAQEIVFPLVNRFVQQKKQMKAMQMQKQPTPQPTAEPKPEPKPEPESASEPTKEQVEAEVKKELEQKMQ